MAHIRVVRVFLIAETAYHGPRCYAVVLHTGQFWAEWVLRFHVPVFLRGWEDAAGQTTEPQAAGILGAGCWVGIGPRRWPEHL
jgi:hypothetical protein